jgi:hypothetical protein
MDNPVQLATLLRQLITEAGVLLPSSEQLSMGGAGYSLSGRDSGAIRTGREGFQNLGS